MEFLFFVVFLHRIIYNNIIDVCNVFYIINSLESLCNDAGRRRVKAIRADISGKRTELFKIVLFFLFGEFVSFPSFGIVANSIFILKDMNYVQLNCYKN